jgi:hypothetical protein
MRSIKRGQLTAWKKNQVFSKASQVFLEALQRKYAI